MNKILFFSHESKMYGAPRSMMILADALKNEYEVEVVTVGDGDLVEVAKQKGIKTHIIANDVLSKIEGDAIVKKVLRRLGRYYSILKASFIIKRFNPDLVYINTISNGMPVMLAEHFKKKFIVHVREGEDYVFPTLEYRIKETAPVFKYTQNFVCVSESIKELVLKRLNGRPASVKRVYNGIDCSEFCDYSGDENSVPDFGDKKVVGFLGNINPRKGLKTFLQAAQEILEQRDDIVFLAVGGDSNGFLDLISELDLHSYLDSSIFHISFLKTPQQAYKKFDIYCMTSLIEPFARVNLEAACMSVPIIATSIDGNKEFVVDGESGLLVPPGNSDALKNSILGLINDEEKKHALVQSAYQRVNEHFSVNRYISESKTIIKEVIEQ